MIKILVIGQTPPPYGGQAMMIKRLVNAKFDKIKIYHLRMTFSENFHEIGKGSIRKVFHLFYLIGLGFIYRYKYDIKILYYLPAGPNVNPLLRDIALLAPLRLIFPKTIFHFRAAGLSELVPTLSIPLQYLAKLVYRKPSVAIQLSSLNPSDGSYFDCKKLYIIPNGLEDAAKEYKMKVRPQKAFVQILSVGVIREDKGVLVLLEAVRLLRNRNTSDFKVKFMGEFNTNDFERKVYDLISEYKLENVVEFIGVRSGDQKWEVFWNTDILCFPTFFESESFGNVNLEAMMFEIPIVATKWRGIPDIVRDEHNGLLVPIKDFNALSDKLEFFIDNKQERNRFGRNGRRDFEEKYKLEEHLSAMEKVFLAVAENKII